MARQNRRRTVSLLSANSTTRRALLYVRYSSEMQRDSWSVEAQLGDIRAECQRRGWEITGEFVDEAESAKDDQRPQFQRCLAAIRAGQGNVIVVHKIDRFSRNMEETFRYVNELEQSGAGLVCTQQPIDMTNAISGKIVLAVLAALAESYLDNLSEETSKGKRARTAAGLSNGDVPYGYVNPEAGKSGDANRTPAVIVPHEAEAVRLAFELYATGQYSDARVAGELNDRGYRMRSKRHPGGYPFTKDTLTGLLDNPFYAGWVTYTGDGYSKRTDEARRTPGKHPALISQDLFDRALTIRAQKRGVGRRGSPLGQSHVYLAGGLVHCTCCKQRLRAQGQATRKSSYRDVSAERGITCATTRKSISATVVEHALGAAISGLHLPEDWHTHAMAQMDTAPQDTARLQAQRTMLERKMQHHKRLLMDGDIDQADYRAEKARIDAEVATLQPAKEEVDLETAAHRLRHLKALWEHATPEERREVVQHLFTAVWCDLNGKRVVAVQLGRAFLSLRNALPKCTQCGSDGIRTRGLLRDRQAC